MYIGKLGDGKHDDDGIYVLIKETIDNSIDEFRMNEGKVVEVSVRPYTDEEGYTGEMVRVAGLTQATVLRIDMANYRCTVNGNYKPADISVTDFWPLEPGTATLQLSGGSGTMTYEERYL